MTPPEYFELMISAVQSDDEIAIEKIQADIDSNVYAISFKVNDVASIPDEYEEYVQLERNISLLINSVSVYEWQEVLRGSRGGDGDEWTVEEAESNLKQDVMETLSFFGVEWPLFEVPKPEELKRELEDLINKIYVQNNMGDEGCPAPDYWVIDDTFVSEPYLGGIQVGEIQDVDLVNKVILKMTQEQFDELLEAHKNIYGLYPHC